MTIKIYSTPTCPYCLQAKSFFDQKKIKYTNIDVSSDEAALKEMQEISSQLGVPVILIDDKVIIGFDQGQIEEILKTNG